LSKYSIENLCINFSIGASSSGSKPIYGTHFPIRSENYRAFKVLNHQHEKEIVSFVKYKTGIKVEPCLIPHVGPWRRGVFTNLYMKVEQRVSEQKIKKIFTDYYKNCPFVRFRDISPETRHVIGTNFTDITVHAKDNTIVVLTALDNLIKGGSGQAVQNFNIMNGFDETEGLWTPGGSAF